MAEKNLLIMFIILFGTIFSFNWVALSNYSKSQPVPRDRDSKYSSVQKDVTETLQKDKPYFLMIGGAWRLSIPSINEKYDRCYVKHSTLKIAGVSYDYGPTTVYEKGMTLRYIATFNSIMEIELLKLGAKCPDT